MNKKMTLSLIAICMFVMQTLFAQEPLPEKYCGKVVMGYVPNWITPVPLDYKLLTHAGFAFLNCTIDGDLVEYTAEQEYMFRDFLKQTKKHHCKRVISLAGGADVIFPAMAESPAARKNFIAQLLKFCDLYKIDCIDMDWEAMDNEVKKKNYTALMKEIRVAIKDTPLKFIATIGFGNYWCQWIENEALQQADWIQIMVYDATGTWADSPFGNHSSFEHFLQAETYWTDRGFDRSKIVLGVPFYGYRFTSDKGGLGAGVAYKDIVSGFSKLSPDEDVTPNNDYCFFNGQTMIQKKSKYLMDKGFGGIMIWEMSQDAYGEKSLMKTIAETFQKECEGK